MTSPSLEGVAPTDSRRRWREIEVERGLSWPWPRIDPAIVALTVLALAAASYRVGVKSLWTDEAISVSHARLGLSGLWTVVSGGDPNMGLYYGMLHIWVRLFGYTDTSVRILGVLLGGLAVPVVAMLGVRLAGRATGLAAGLLLALAPFFVHYEQTVRSYALLVTLVALSSYFFVVEIERPSRRTRIGYVLASALSIYAHYVAAFVLVMQALTLLVVKRRVALTRRWLTAGVWLAFLCAPEVAFADRAGHGLIDWIWQPSLRDAVHLPVDLAGEKALACVLILLACYGFARLVAGGRRWQAGFVAAWCVGPVLLDLAITWLGRPLFLSYYLIVVLPAWLLLAAAGLVRLPGRAVRLMVLGLLVALSVVGLASWYRQPSQENYRAATQFLLRHARPGDAVLYDPGYAGVGFAHYEALAHTGGPPALGALPAAPADGRPARIWLVFRPSPGVEQIAVERSLAAGYAQVGRETAFSNLSLILYGAR